MGLAEGEADASAVAGADGEAEPDGDAAESAAGAEPDPAQPARASNKPANPAAEAARRLPVRFIEAIGSSLGAMSMTTQPAAGLPVQ